MIEQAKGFEPMTSRLVDNHRRAPERDGTGRGTGDGYVLVLYRTELRLHESGWQESHLRPRGPEPRVLLLNYTQRTSCGTPPANRTLQVLVWGQDSSQTATYRSVTVTHGPRPARCHREESNLHRRSSQNRVPSLERWQVTDRRLGSHQHLRSLDNHRAPARIRARGCATINRRPAVRQYLSVVAADGIEPSRARVWAAPVPCTGCAGIRG